MFRVLSLVSCLFSFLIVGSNVYHQVLNEDVSIAEAINFGTKDWLLERENARFCYCDKHPVQLRFTDEFLKECKSLQDDLDKEIPKAETGPFLCLFCEKNFNQKSNQRQHIKRVHLKLFSKCEKCGKKLSFYKLNRHMKNIHKIAKKHKAKNPKDFICKVCENTFSTKFNLKQHIQSTHIGEKHTCKHCSKTFGTKRSLVRHNKIIHGSVKIKCKKCEMTFNQVCNMKRHFNTFHN